MIRCEYNIKMNHQKIYESIIQKAKFENRIKLRKNQENYIYYENHHIIPKCLGGSDEEKNKVLLTAREHYICHKLLTYIYKENRKIVCAFHMMTFNKRINKHNKTSRDYMYARELISSTPISMETRKKLYHGGEKNPMFGKHQKEESKIKQSKKMKGRKLTKEHKNKVKISNTGKIRSKESRNKMSISALGENNSMYGKTIYDVWIKKYGKEEADKKWSFWLNNVRLGVIKRQSNKNK